MNDINLNKNKNVLIQTLQPTLDEYHKYLNEQNMEGVLGMIHSASPAQVPTRQLLNQLFNIYQLKNELLDAKYVGNDDDYIYIKMKQKIIKLEGPEFRDNISDSLVAMKMEGNVWKVWSIMPLEVSIL